jgi:transcriptional regulator with XRE-family HTH domain
VRAADLIREARLRAGLTQQQLADRSGRERSVIARWEQGAVSPSVDNLLEVIQACGFDLPLVLAPRESHQEERLEKNLLLTPERRTQRLLASPEKQRGVPEQFDPYALLQALDRHRVTYVLIGGFARIVQGTEEPTHGLDLTPAMREQNLERLERALREIDARRADGRALTLDEATLAARPVHELDTRYGELKLVAQPAGTRGYDDLRRAASREPLGHGVRPSVASVGDLARMLAALGDETRLPQLMQLRRITELERTRSRGIER